ELHLRDSAFADGSADGGDQQLGSIFDRRFHGRGRGGALFGGGGFHEPDADPADDRNQHGDVPDRGAGVRASRARGGAGADAVERSAADGGGAAVRDRDDGARAGDLAPVSGEELSGGGDADHPAGGAG